MRLMVGAVAPICVREGGMVHILSERSESGSVWSLPSREAHGHHGASVKGIFKGDDAGPTGIRPCDLDRILDGLGAAIEQCRLLVEAAGDDLGEPTAHLQIRLVGGHAEAAVNELLSLLTDGVHHRSRRVAGVDSPDPARKVDVALPVDIPELCSMGPIDHNGGRIGSDSRGNVLLSALEVTVETPSHGIDGHASPT